MAGNLIKIVVFSVIFLDSVRCLNTTRLGTIQSTSKEASRRPDTTNSYSESYSDAQTDPCPSCSSFLGSNPERVASDFASTGLRRKMLEFMPVTFLQLQEATEQRSNQEARKILSNTTNTFSGRKKEGDISSEKQKVNFKHDSQQSDSETNLSNIPRSSGGNTTQNTDSLNLNTNKDSPDFLSTGKDGKFSTRWLFHCSGYNLLSDLVREPYLGGWYKSAEKST
mmetsp:Transcript_37295/g.42344  ORF Transcript_37295/g.42344 Transcript_37295/m.42344 type:complete len:224 (+) Transcript_37295:47-718(+)